jgi:hypothetical protein
MRKGQAMCANIKSQVNFADGLQMFITIYTLNVLLRCARIFARLANYPVGLTSPDAVMQGALALKTNTGAFQNKYKLEVSHTRSSSRSCQVCVHQ